MEIIITKLENKKIVFKKRNYWCSEGQTMTKIPTGTISIFACVYWILFFKYPDGIYFEHMYILLVASCLTLLVGYLDYRNLIEVREKWCVC